MRQTHRGAGFLAYLINDMIQHSCETANCHCRFCTFLNVSRVLLLQSCCVLNAQNNYVQNLQNQSSCSQKHIYTRRYIWERDIYIVYVRTCVSTLGVTTCVRCACVCSAKRWPAPSSGMAAREEAASLVKGNLQPYIPTMAGMCSITQTQMLRAPVAIPGCPSAVWPLVPQHVHIQGIHPVWWFAITRKVWKHTAQNY